MSATGKVIGTSLLTLTLGSSIAFGAVAGADLNKLKLENQTLTETNTTITEENTNLKTSLAEYIAEQKTLQDNLTTCQTALNLANTNLTNVEAELELSEAEVLSLTNDKTELENNIASLNSQISTLTSEKEQLTNNLATANENLQTKENELLTVNSSLAEKQTELEAKKTELENLQLEYENLGEENSTLKTNIESLTSEVTTLEGEVTTLTNEKTTLESQITTLTNEKTNLEAQVEQLEDDIDVVEVIAGTLDLQLQEAEYNLGVVTEERDSLLTEKQTLQNQISALQTTIEELNVQVEKLEKGSLPIEVIEERYDSICVGGLGFSTCLNQPVLVETSESIKGINNSEIPIVSYLFDRYASRTIVYAYSEATSISDDTFFLGKTTKYSFSNPDNYAIDSQNAYFFSPYELTNDNFIIWEKCEITSKTYYLDGVSCAASIVSAAMIEQNTYNCFVYDVDSKELSCHAFTSDFVYST